MAKKAKTSLKSKKAISKKPDKKVVDKKPAAKKTTVKASSKTKSVKASSTKPVVKKAIVKKTVKAVKVVAKKTITKKPSKPLNVVSKKNTGKKPHKAIKAVAKNPTKTLKKVAKPIKPVAKKSLAKKVVTKTVVKPIAAKKPATTAIIKPAAKPTISNKKITTEPKTVVAKPEKVVNPKLEKKPVAKKTIIAPTTYRKEEMTAKTAKEPAGKFEMEFVIRASEDMVYEFISTESGLSEWFCDDVNIRNGIFTFTWEGQQQQAKLVKEMPPLFIRYQWLDKNDGSYFEFRIQKDELTNDISLIITDFATDKADEESARLLWSSQIDKLLHVLGSFF